MSHQSKQAKSQDAPTETAKQTRGPKTNLGRCKNSKALGPPVRFRGLHQFGFTRNNIAAESNGIVGTPLEAMAVADGANIGPPNINANNNNQDQPNTGTPLPPPPPAWMVENQNAQLDPIDVMPTRNHNWSKRYNPSGLLLHARRSVNADGYRRQGP
jgi:hypothetical protein